MTTEPESENEAKLIEPGPDRSRTASSDSEVPRRPVAEAQRIESLDVLRGFAVLGILVMNIQSFAMPDSAYSNPMAYGSMEGANLWVWVLSHIFADQKFMTLFSLLFGAGLALMAGRMEERGESGWSFHLRRMGWLLVIGMIHAYGIWGGDILVAYAVCGMLVFAFRKLSPSRLAVIGGVVLVIPLVFSSFGAVSLPDWPQESVEATDAQWQPDAAAIGDEVAAFRASWWQQMEYRAGLAYFFQVPAFLLWTLWRAGGLMLIGMACFKTGILSGDRSGRWYRWLAVVGFAIGLPLIAVGVLLNFQHGWDWRWSYFVGGMPNYVGSLLVAAGYLGLVVGGSSGALGRPGLPLQRPLAAAGRMAFSNYLGQSILCFLLFNSPGLRWFGSVERTGQVAVVVGVWIFQLIFSSWWLGRFRFGPAEWLWRSLSYGRIQPMRR